MDIRRIRYFLALTGSLDFSRTARSLGITQPALTKAMNRLESEIGGKLLRREGRHTHLTPLGEAMTEQFAEVDRAAREAEETARLITRGIGTQIRLGIHPSIGPLGLIELLMAFHARSPGTVIELHDVASRDLHDALLRGRLDCAFTIGSGSDEPRLHHVPLYEEPLVAVMATDAPASTAETGDVLPSITVDDVECANPLAWLPGPTSAIIASSERDDWTQALVGAGLGRSVLPRDSVIDASVRVEPLDARAPSRRIVLAIPTGREDNPTIRGFLELARRFAERRMGRPTDDSAV